MCIKLNGIWPPKLRQFVDVFVKRHVRSCDAAHRDSGFDHRPVLVPWRLVSRLGGTGATFQTQNFELNSRNVKTLLTGSLAVSFNPHQFWSPKYWKLGGWMSAKHILVGLSAHLDKWKVSITIRLFPLFGSALFVTIQQFVLLRHKICSVTSYLDEKYWPKAARSLFSSLHRVMTPVSFYTHFLFFCLIRTLKV